MMRPLLCALIALVLGHPAAAPAQQIALVGDLPRAMVFLREDGSTASIALTTFLREAGFEVIDATFARTAAEQETARLALGGDDVAATALGRDLGAQVIILGSAPADAAPNPADPALQLGTAQVDVRALRLDETRIVATGSVSGRAVDGTPASARVGALRNAVEALARSGFLGRIVNDWTRVAWNDPAYWEPEPASLAVRLQARARPQGSTQPASEPIGVAILESTVVPDSTRARGIVVVDRQPEVARIRGLVTEPDAQVFVGSAEARLRALTTTEISRYGLDSGGAIFETAAPLLDGQDTVRVRAEARRGRTELLVHPRVGRRWAVVIGISAYSDRRVQALQYADDDARAMHAFLRSPAGGAIPDAQLRLLVNEQATGAAIREALFVFLQEADEDDLVTIYVAAHGAPDPKRPSNLYILPHDVDLDAIASTAFPMWDFKTAVRRQIAAERIVVIADACHSGGTVVDEANPIGAAFGDLFSPSRRVTLTAAGPRERSLEGERWGTGAGVFTHTLLAGLAGAADSDRDGVVTFSEAALYVEQRVPQETGGRQNPMRTGLGDLPLAVLARSDAR